MSELRLPAIRLSEITLPVAPMEHIKKGVSDRSLLLFDLLNVVFQHSTSEPSAWTHHCSLVCICVCGLFVCRYAAGPDTPVLSDHDTSHASGRTRAHHIPQVSTVV